MEQGMVAGNVLEQLTGKLSFGLKQLWMLSEDSQQTFIELG
jgi:hypothetical protein